LGAVLLATALIGPSTALAASGGCHSFSGSYVQQSVPCPPALVCVDSTITGDWQGVSHTAVTTYDPITNIYTGQVTTTRVNGSVITATIEGVAGSGVGVETITGGTRQFVGATGTIVATGSPTVGTYSGQYCLPEDSGS
jgi:hypothetical protein